MPSVVFGNVESLISKMDELESTVHFISSFRNACAIALCETWLHELVSNDEVSVNGFTCIRGDRTEESGKEKGGGVLLYQNDKSCNNAMVTTRVCTTCSVSSRRSTSATLEPTSSKLFNLR